MTARKPLPVDLIDALLADYKKPEDLIGEEGLLKQLTKALVERAINAEMIDHLGHSKHTPLVDYKINYYCSKIPVDLNLSTICGAKYCGFAV